MEYEITKCHYCGTAMYRLRVLNDCGKEMFHAKIKIYHDDLKSQQIVTK